MSHPSPSPSKFNTVQLLVSYFIFCWQGWSDHPPTRVQGGQREQEVGQGNGISWTPKIIRITILLSVKYFLTFWEDSEQTDWISPQISDGLVSGPLLKCNLQALQQFGLVCFARRPPTGIFARAGSPLWAAAIKRGRDYSGPALMQTAASPCPVFLVLYPISFSLYLWSTMHHSFLLFHTHSINHSIQLKASHITHGNSWKLTPFSILQMC